MIQLGQTLISLDLLDEYFACDLQACKGECCVQGDAGAPLEVDELEILARIYPEVKPYMRPEGIKAVEEQGLYTVDASGDYVTPLVEGRECAYVYFENGIAFCAIEKAYREGRIDFPKPVSCHLYPVRLKEIGGFTALNYHRWEICSPACALGARLKMPLYRFLKEPLIRRFGAEWYAELDEVAKAYKARGKSRKSGK